MTIAGDNGYEAERVRLLAMRSSNFWSVDQSTFLVFDSLLLPSFVSCVGWMRTLENDMGLACYLTSIITARYAHLSQPA
ncbi:hypothetical protein WN943_028017 [Citrus x changshan-huyou]